MRISSSVTASSSASVLSRSTRRTPLVDFDRNQITGRMTKEMPDTTRQANFATSKDFCMAMRFGTSSPKIKVK